MSRSVDRAAVQTRLENVPTRMAKAKTTSNLQEISGDTVDDREVLSLIDTARRRAGLKWDYLSARSGVSVSQLSGAVNGHSGFNVRWLWSFPPEFWGEFLPLLQARKGEGEQARRQRHIEELKSAIVRLLDVGMEAAS